MVWDLTMQWVFLGLPLASLALGCGLTFFRMNKILISVLIWLRGLELFGALVLLVEVFRKGAFEANFFGATLFSTLKIEFGLRADELSTVIFTMIALLSFCIFKYSIRYLDGDLHRSKFFRDFQFTIFCVVLLVLSNNLAFFFIAWLGISYGLHKMLLYYDNRPKAILAARKKWVVSRIGDISLLLGIISTYIFFKTLNFSELILIAHNTGMMEQIYSQKYFSFIGVFIAIGALAKSAQFPFHFWLPETMETPTPVSALMHAGIINAGGYLIMRLSPVFIHADFAHIILVFIGGVTAVFGALIMMTKTDVKKQLAYSTISQLGFMMIQCGIGLYSFALFHMIAHGFYKAHAFLSTPLVLKENKARSIEPKKDLFYAIKKNLLYTSSFFIASLCIYIVFEFAVSSKFKNTIPNDYDSKLIVVFSILFLFVLFSIGIYLAAKMKNISNLKSKKIWMFFWNGCYFSVFTSKVFRK